MPVLYRYCKRQQDVYCLLSYNGPMAMIIHHSCDPCLHFVSCPSSCLSSIIIGFLPIDAVALGTGAFCGAFCRYQVGRIAGQTIAQNPQALGAWTGWHTAGINIVGSFILGVISQTPSPPMMGGMSPRAHLMLVVGFCGSFTTISTFSVDVAQWLLKGQTTMALKYVLTNNVGSIGAAAAGMALVKRLVAYGELRRLCLPPVAHSVRHIYCL